MVSRHFRFLAQDTTSGFPVWSNLLAKEFDVDYAAFHQAYYDDEKQQDDRIRPSPRQLFVSRRTARTSMVGMVWPELTLKDSKKIEYAKRYIKANDVRCPYVLHLHHTNARTRRVAAMDVPDGTSHFGQVLFLVELNRIQIEGNHLIKFAGPYKVVWRLKVDADYALGTMSFITKLVTAKTEADDPLSDFHDDYKYDGISQCKYQWNAGEHSHHAGKPFPMNDWFDLTAAYIHVKKAPQQVYFAAHQWDLDWKYALSIDYVEFVPVTWTEYNAAKLGVDEDEFADIMQVDPQLNDPNNNNNAAAAAVGVGPAQQPGGPPAPGAPHQQAPQQAFINLNGINPFVVPDAE